MVVKLTTLEQELLRRFRAAYQGIPPDWAWPYPPPIPLVGSKYAPGRGLLVYASAENLHGLAKRCPPHDPRWCSFSGEAAWVRYRHRYEVAGRQSCGFFPEVGMKPVNDGGLLCAAWFVIACGGQRCPPTPRELLDRIAVTNWCKFVLCNPCRNQDYAGDLQKLAHSRPLVEAELDVLRPRFAIVPKSVFLGHGEVREGMTRASPRTTFIPVMQFNGRVINTHLKRHDAEGPRLAVEWAGTPLAEWMSQVRNMSRSHAWRFIAHLSEVMAASLPQG